VPRFQKTANYTEEAKRLGIYDPNRKLCILIASSPSWLKDFDGFKAKFPDIKFDVIAINKTLMRTEKVDHWCSMHPRSHIDAGSLSWKQARLDRGWDNDFKAHSPRVPAGKVKMKEKHWTKYIDYIWSSSMRLGSSSMFGMGVAIGMGYSGIVVCGVSLTGKYRRYLRIWNEFQRRYPDYARCQSGIVKKSMGCPTEEWINKKMGVVK